jgi:hypothetical protein
MSARASASCAPNPDAGYTTAGAPSKATPMNQSLAFVGESIYDG